jgi:polyhydroxyalkanoate synthesis regulator phasin
MAESERSERPSSDAAPDRVGEQLRSAVERTLAATAGSASETQQRARELLDEVARRGDQARGELSRRGDAAREQVSRRAGAARGDIARRGEETAHRLAAAIGELRQTDRGDLGVVGEQLGALEKALGDLERILRGERDSEQVSKPEVEGEKGPDEADSGA